jgi:hypothetical protein
VTRNLTEDMSRGSVVCTVTRLPAGEKRTCGSIPDRDKGFLSPSSYSPALSVAFPGSYSKGTEIFFLEGNAAGPCK